MNRRAFLIAGPLASASPLMSFGPARAASSDLTVIYVGGGDCPPCVQWKNTQKARWLASPEYKK
ncbi:MAG: hypothetical protein QOJ17_273, partial [Rhodospirillaceae bacterium]|nr:hypothetical protein [Rhodospirillaceae bacterium]